MAYEPRFDIPAPAQKRGGPVGEEAAAIRDMPAGSSIDFPGDIRGERAKRAVNNWKKKRMGQWLIRTQPDGIVRVWRTE